MRTTRFSDAHVTVNLYDWTHRTEEFHSLGYWDELFGSPWYNVAFIADPAPVNAATFYAVRSGLKQLPDDNEVLYGSIGTTPFLVHVSEVVE